MVVWLAGLAAALRERPVEVAPSVGAEPDGPLDLADELGAVDLRWREVMPCGEHLVRVVSPRRKVGLESGRVGDRRCERRATDERWGWAGPDADGCQRIIEADGPVEIRAEPSATSGATLRRPPDAGRTEVREVRVVVPDAFDDRDVAVLEALRELCQLRVQPDVTVEVDRVLDAERWSKIEVRGVRVRDERVEPIVPAAELDDDQRVAVRVAERTGTQ